MAERVACVTESGKLMEVVLEELFGVRESAVTLVAAAPVEAAQPVHACSHIDVAEHVVVRVVEWKASLRAVDEEKNKLETIIYK